MPYNILQYINNNNNNNNNNRLYLEYLLCSVIMTKLTHEK